MQLAPLGVLVDKLRARSPAVRIAALAHVAGHGSNAQPLAARVAALLTDDEDVSWHAAQTLRAIAPGATDAVPVLLEQLGHADAPEVVVRRALSGLQRVGPEAWAALPLLEKLLGGPRRAEAIEAMAAIAPDNPRVTAAILEAVFAADFAASRAGCEALRHGSPALLDLAAAQLRLRAFSFSKLKRDSALTRLYDFASLRPQSTTQLMLELARGSNPRKWILRAMEQLPAPMSPELAERARACLQEDDVQVQELALRVLEKHALGTEPRALVQRHFEAPAVGGPKGMAARVFAQAALMLAKAGKLDGAELEQVEAWLTRTLRLTPKQQPDLSWYTVRSVVAAAVKSSPKGFLYAVTAARAASRFMDTDESGVLDLHRTLRGLAASEADWAALAAAGVPRKDPYDDDAGDEEPEGEVPVDGYPDIPDDIAPPPPSRLEPADAPDQRAELEHGLHVLGLGPTARPLQLAEALEAYFARRRREQPASPDAQATDGLAAVWAHCLMTGFRWRWAWYVRGLDEKALVLASPDGAYIIFPSAWVRRQLLKRESTALLQFNTLSQSLEPPKSSEPVALW
jgi:hypothetical protein